MGHNDSHSTRVNTKKLKHLKNNIPTSWSVDVALVVRVLFILFNYQPIETDTVSTDNVQVLMLSFQPS